MMNKIVPSIIAFGAGAYAYKMAEDRGMLSKRNINKMRKRVIRALS